MSQQVEELRLDVEELKRLADATQSQSVKNILSGHISKLEMEISQLQVKEVPQVKTTVPKVPKCYDVKLTNYAWDQSDKFVKIFITLPKVHTLSSENVKCTFTDRSVEFQARELDGRNHLLTIKNLLEEVEPARSHWKVKTDNVVIFIAKAKPANWAAMTVDEKKVKDASVPKVDPASAEDPNAGLMNMLKQMYENGDDEMKRTIAKSFAESRTKQPGLQL